ncbi:hypothetical protein Ahy_B09g096325 isoform G [Arachis hypogaea]|uniref:Uncharacterized protein n=1 Tax=Arachis hypogaea TaxID=3818 RepID=A0A444XJU9_ARAHY|nr:hypothetical protein Ahy_B09g096325 isoform G [Arachis hypogaea]
MGIISRKIFPACGSMCVCCPALRSRSRQPVKRYRKLLADIFPKSPDEFPSERKIIKLCEYAARNPFRIPKIAKHLEERCYKELRSEHIKIKPVKIVAETFNKLISVCKVQIAYFAVNVLDVMSELLGCSKDETIQTLGCQVLTTFIYSQVDATYTHNMEKLVRKVCMLSREHVGALEKRCLRASSLQCLSAMIWFMAEFSHIFVDLDEIIDAVLDNYKCGTPIEDGGVRAEPHHNWVDEVVRREGRGGSVVSDGIHSSCSIIQPEPEKKDPSRLTREESETPEIWAQICIQRMVELAKERSTMRRVMDRMFVYFDSRQHWAPQQGLAAKVLSSMAYFMENSAFSTGNQQLILTCVVHHLDHKNVMNDPKLKTYIVQVATSLSMQIRSGAGLKEIGFVGDLCRHLRKSLQSSGSEFVGEQEFNVNISLQNSIEDCLLEIANGVTDTQPLFDLMAITLESLPSGPLARATIGSVIVLARVVTLALSRLNSQQGFPEVLLVQLLKVMLHPDLEARVGAHVIFSGLLFPSSFQTHDDSSIRSVYTDRHSKKSFQTASTSASITALLEKLRKDQDGIKTEGHGSAIHDGCKEKDITAEDYKPGYGLKNSPNFCKLSSIIDRAMGSPSLTDTELGIMKLNEDQIGQLLSSFWIQANLPDNLPANFEAISHSFISTLLVLRAKNLKDKDNLLIRFFQLPLSLWTMLLDSSNGMLPPSHQRSVFVLSTGMLMSACKVYQIHDLNDVFTSLAMSEDFPSGSGVEDDTISEASVSDLSRFVPKMPPSPSVPHVISIGQLMESALEVAGQVAGSTVSTSPLPYNAMASQCEKLGTYARKKLSNWLTFENHHYSPAADKYLPPICDNWKSALEKVCSVSNSNREPWLAMKLPPASPFDNFLKAAGC